MKLHNARQVLFLNLIDRLLVLSLDYTDDRSTVINASSNTGSVGKVESDMEEYSELNGKRMTETPSYLERTETETTTDKTSSLYTRTEPTASK